MLNYNRKLKEILRLLRFELPFSAGVCVVMGQILALGKFASISDTTFGFLSVFLISASILVLNDYFDVETDKLNAPYRPIPSNAVTSSEALFLSIILMLFGLILSYLVSVIALLLSFFLLIVGFLYNRTYKKSGLPGNLMVSFSVGMTFIYGGVSVGLPFNNVVLLFGLIAALIDLGEEIAADAMDMQGDLLINSNSLAIKYGKQIAIQTSIYIFFYVILLTSVPFILRWLPAIYLVPIAIIDASIAYSSLRLLESSDNKDSRKEDSGRKYIRWIYLGATVGLLVFISMRLLEA